MSRPGQPRPSCRRSGSGRAGPRTCSFAATSCGPESLDHLASKLIESKWSLKELHRYIVTSATYLQSSKTRPELTARDSSNILLARQNRIRFEAEVLRDNALAVSSLLSRKIGGPS